jgi:hypothetical protein
MNSAKSPSARDLDTLRRLDARYGRQKFLELIRNMPELRSRRRPGAPKQAQLRPTLLATLYVCASLGHAIAISAFAKEISEVAELRFGRIRKGGTFTYSGRTRSRAAIEQDIRRGMMPVNRDQFQQSLCIWMCWRMTAVNSAWSFLVGSAEQSITIRPKKPKKLIEWIDSAIDAAQVRPQLQALVRRQ